MAFLFKKKQNLNFNDLIWKINGNKMHQGKYFKLNRNQKFY